MDDVGLHVAEELEVGRALEKLFGLKPTGHPFLKYKDAVEKVGLLGLGQNYESRLNWKDAIQSLPYQGRYTLSDVEVNNPFNQNDLLPERCSVSLAAEQIIRG